MGFSDSMCYGVATDIINNIFWKKYSPTIIEKNTWYKNLNEFLVKEWDRLQETEDLESHFTENEEENIIRDAMDILLDKLNVDGDKFEETEQEIDWTRFDDIIGHYMCDV
jgi:hypothetical protein